MATPYLVDAFYHRIWNAGDLDTATELLADDVSFRGSLGGELRGREAFKDYARDVLGALAGYHCEIVTCVAETERAFAQVNFSGVHVGPFRGHEPTGKRVHWVGAALFRFERDKIADVWVLGDLAGLDRVLEANEVS